MQKKIMHIVCIAYRLIAVGKLPIWLRYTPGKMYLKEMMTGMNILSFIVQLKNKSIHRSHTILEIRRQQKKHVCFKGYSCRLIYKFFRNISRNYDIYRWLDLAGGMVFSHSIWQIHVSEHFCASAIISQVWADPAASLAVCCTLQ